MLRAEISQSTASAEAFESHPNGSQLASWVLHPAVWTATKTGPDELRAEGLL